MGEIYMGEIYTEKKRRAAVLIHLFLLSRERGSRPQFYATVVASGTTPIPSIFMSRTSPRFPGIGTKE